jgi:hypothetical protein
LNRLLQQRAGTLVPKCAFIGEMRRETEQRTAGVTALQDFLNISPITPQDVKAFVLAPFRAVLPAAETEAADLKGDQPVLRRGVERC